MHTYILLPIITAVSLLVLGLLLWVVARYRRGRIRCRRRPATTR
jgi:cytochrome c oxidase subunit 2